MCIENPMRLIIYAVGFVLTRLGAVVIFGILLYYKLRFKPSGSLFNDQIKPFFDVSIISSSNNCPVNTEKIELGKWGGFYYGCVCLSEIFVDDQCNSELFEDEENECYQVEDREAETIYNLGGISLCGRTNEEYTYKNLIENYSVKMMNNV